MSEQELRDYFAGKAMQGIVQGMFADGEVSTFVSIGVAQDAYAIADAMMKVITGSSPEECYKFADEMLEARKHKEEKGIVAIKPRRRKE